MRKKPLTKKQKEVYSIIVEYMKYGGSAPTGIKISRALQITTQAVDQHVRNIAAKGWLKYKGGRYSTIQLT